MTTPRLITIPMSHYCEKARWCLERHGVEYVEERHLQGFHYLASMGKGGGALVPVLVRDGSKLADSTRILEALDEEAPEDTRLYPDDDELRREVQELEERFDEGLGVAARLIIYDAYLAHPDLMLRTAAQGCPSWQPAVARALFPLMRVIAARRLRLSNDAVERSMSVVREAFADVSRRLEDRRRYLVGDRFTAADLTFACMASPVLLPPEYGIPLPDVEDVVPALRPFVVEMRSTPAGAFALRLFREERRRALP